MDMVRCGHGEDGRWMWCGVDMVRMGDGCGVDMVRMCNGCGVVWTW